MALNLEAGIGTSQEAQTSFNNLLPASGNTYADKYGLTFNIICHDNKAGLSKDYKILEDKLTLLGCKVNHVNIHYGISPKELDKIKNNASLADVNIFIEHLFEELFPLARKNFFIPNPDYCLAPEEVISKLDLILCRTEEVRKIFKPLNPNIFFLGFTSVDKLDYAIEKNYTSFLHLSTNHQKGTNTIYSLWACRPDFPHITVVRAFSNDQGPKIPNLTLINSYIPEENINRLQNMCGIHLCPSETEGFGHYIVEAMSTGAVVITTDAPPMNEFIKDKRCLVGYSEVKSQRLATAYCVDPTLLNEAIDNLLNLPKEELEKIGENNRVEYLKGKHYFQKRLKQLMSEAQNGGPASGGNTIILNGEDFADVSDVLFGSRPSMEFTINSPSSISVTVPPGTPGETVAIELIASGDVTPFSTMNQYTYLPPAIIKAEHTKGPAIGGETMILHGRHLGDVKNIFFGPVPATDFTLISPNTLLITTPQYKPGTVDLILETNYGPITFPSVQYTYLTPKITKVKQDSGPAAGGNSIILKGKNCTGVTSISFGDNQSTDFSVDSDNTITVVVPPGMPGKVDVVISICGIRSEMNPEVKYTYLPLRPPRNFKGKVVDRKVHRLSWDKSLDETVIAYHLYKNGKLQMTFTEKGPFTYESRHAKKEEIVYTLVSVNKHGLESEALKVILK